MEWWNRVSESPQKELDCCSRGWRPKEKVFLLPLPWWIPMGAPEDGIDVKE